MSKIYADHDDFHVKATVLYMDSSANLFEDAECTKRASKEDVIDAFKKGTLLLEEPNGDEIVRPTSINVNDATVGTGGSGGGGGGSQKLYKHTIYFQDDNDWIYDFYIILYSTKQRLFDDWHGTWDEEEWIYNDVPPSDLFKNIPEGHYIGCGSYDGDKSGMAFDVEILHHGGGFYQQLYVDGNQSTLCSLGAIVDVAIEI